MSGDFSPEQKRYLEGFSSGLQIARAGRGLRRRQGRGAGADGPRRGASRRAGPHRRGRRQAQRPGKVQARAASVRRLSAASRSRPTNNESPKPADNFRWRYYGLFYVAPAQDSYMCRLRMPNGILKHWQIRGLGRPRRALRRRLFACHDARQPADPRDRAEERGRDGRGDPGSRALLARLRRRQHPQRHRHADRRHRSAGIDRHAALRARMALPHPQRARALRPAAQVQCRLRRRRHSFRCWRTPTTSASRPSR